MITVLHSATLVDGTGAAPVGDAWVAIDGTTIARRGTGDGWRVLPYDEAIDARELAGAGAILTPGFIDLHGHGGAGVSYDDGADAIKQARRMHLAHGTTRAVISLVTAPVELLEERVRVIAALAREDDSVLGSHLEGPFLDVGHKGAHDPELLVDPEQEAVARLLSAGDGTVVQVTIAPERAGGMAAVQQITAAGALAAVGHTNADYAETRAAFDAGARLLTHTFNAMEGIHHRKPGPVVAGIDDERVTLEVIADGVHVDLSVIRMLFSAAPGRVALVTDAMAAAGSTDGDYILGALAVKVRDGIARLAEGGSIAGSTLTLDVAIRNLVKTGVPLEAAVEAATNVPAKTIGRDDIGRVNEGALADLVVLDERLAVAAVWRNGARQDIAPR